MANLRKKTKDIGIQVTTGYYNNAKEKTHQCKLFFIQLLLLAASVLSGLFCFITSMEVKLYNKTLILLTCVFAVFFLLALTWHRISHIAIVSAVFVLLLYWCEKIEHYLEGIYHLENVVVKAFNEYFGENLFYYVVAQKDGRYDLTFLFAMIAFLMCLVGAFAIHKGRMQYGYLLLLLLTVIIPCVFGRIPNSGIFVVYVVCIFGVIELIASYRRQRKHVLNDWQRAYALGISSTCMLIMAILMIGLNGWFSKEQYENIPIPEWKGSITRYVDAFDNKGGGIHTVLQRKGNQSVGGLNGGELDLNNGRIRFNHKTQLVVKMTRPQSGFFLKGYAGVNYEGNSWSEATQRQIGSFQGLLNGMEKGAFIPDNYTINQLGDTRKKTGVLKGELPERRLSIEYVNANMKYLYYPYYTWFDASKVKQQKENVPLIYGEAYVRPTQEKRNYSMTYYEAPNNITEFEKSVPTMLGDEAFSYFQYVDDIYLSVPEDGLDRLKEEFSEYARQLRLSISDENSSVTVENVISFVKNYLQNAATYSLTPGKTPKDKDYIEYFLYENHKGYCAHYASAATIMLRLLGLPARYVEGYYVSDALLENAKIVEMKNHEEPQIEIKVDDSCAHAWVEVYIAGVGWYPVDVTGVSTERDEELHEVTRTPTPTPKKEKPTPEPTKPPEKEKSLEKRKTSSIQGKNPILAGILQIVVVVLIMVIAVIGFHKYRKEYWSKYLRRRSRSELCIAWYHRMLELKSKGEPSFDIDFSYDEEQYESKQSLCIGKNYEEYDKLHSIYLKAVYSKDVLTEDEFDLVKHKIRQEYYQYLITHSRIRRIWHRFYMTLPF